MARGFMTDGGYGAGSTDVVTSAAFTSITTQTHSIWVYRDGFAGTDLVNSQNIWGHPDTGLQWIDSADARADQFSYVRAWTGNGNWYWTKSTYKTWVNMVIAYDGGSTSNAPVAYYNGVSQTVNLFTAPTGSITNSSSAYSVGNRGDGARVWNGMLAEFAVWNRILTDGEILALGKGYSPAFFLNGLLEYIPMLRDNISLKNAAPTITGTAVQPQPSIIYPSSKAINWRFFARPMPSVAALGFTGIAGRMDLGIPTQTTLKI